jgi:hypothetical protein
MIEWPGKRRWGTPALLAGWVVSTMLLSATPAAAEQWPAHGFFVVSSKLTPKGQQACELLLSLQVEKRVFALGWVELEDHGAPMIMNYISANPRVALAKRVVVSIDGTDVLTFHPTSHSINAEVAAVAGPVSGRAAAAAWQAMLRTSANAKWLTVKTGETTTDVPASGLREALADLVQCRSRHST